MKDADGYVSKYTRRKENFAREGTLVVLDPQGVKIEEATYRNDTLDGLRLIFYQTGDTQIVETYRNGKFEGPFNAYYPSGQLELEGQYENDAMTGRWKRYYDSGELMEIVTFSDNEENGPFFEYYRNGNLKAEGHYLNGDNEHGSLKLYNEEGEHIKTMNCDHGVCRTIWEKEKEIQ